MWVFLLVCHNDWRLYWPFVGKFTDAKARTDLPNGALSPTKCPVGPQ